MGSHNMKLSSWLDIPQTSHFSLRNIPFGIISDARNASRRVGVPIGDHVLDLQAFAAGNGFSELPSFQTHLEVFSSASLNDFAALGQNQHGLVRKYLQDVFRSDATPSISKLLKENNELQSKALIPLVNVTTHLPMRIGDYTDFFAGIRHAFTVGSLFRGPANALQPNYSHLPVGYHGRASSVVVSGTPIVRPRAQVLPPGAKDPLFIPSKRLDIELEFAAFVCKPNALGRPIPVNNAEAFIFGYVLMNDWSARDVQTWEYVPLGPFTAKNFGTTISPWVVLHETLQPFATAGLPNETSLHDYLKESSTKNVFDISLEVQLTTKHGKPRTISKSNTSNLIWSFPQMLAHHTITGCNMEVGDLLGSGTISGPTNGTQGSLLEMSNGGKEPFDIGDGEKRTFLEDGDTINIVGWAGDEDTGLIGFGDCAGQILPPL